MKIPPGVNFFLKIVNWGIKYFNTIFEENKVIYPNETSDYIIKEDFDGVQVVLL